MNGNIALSMEIGSAYALQVCLLQIPALVLFSALYQGPGDLPGVDIDQARYNFSLLFPQWDMVTVILCIFLLSYMYGEGKSNYFKGSILLLSYLVVVVGYYFSGFISDMDAPGGVVATISRRTGSSIPMSSDPSTIVGRYSRHDEGRKSRPCEVTMSMKRSIHIPT